jgi:hypothetical protein
MMGISNRLIPPVTAANLPHFGGMDALGTAAFIFGAIASRSAPRMTSEGGSK